MKGVIMAGGKGTRLRPLTCNLPKPMVPLIHKPTMEYSIELLKQYGITEIAVTVQYLSDSIKDYFGDGSRFGVNLHYFDETTPLGTAGSIKNAEDFLDERFIVISGDGLTDFDLSKGINYHVNKESMVTIFMKQVENPLEYGVIMTDDNGEIVRFLEKPTWSEVFSDTVNTGIYVLEPEIFSYLEKGVPTDFSKDLFPLLMKEGKPLYGYQAEGYWSDVGSLNQYRQTHYDMLDGRVQVSLPGEEKIPGVWIGNNVVIEEGAEINAPVAIGDGAVIRKGAKIESYSIIGPRSVITSEASLKRSIIWNDIYVGHSCELRGVTVANRTHIEAGASLYEHSVIGENCRIGKQAQVKPEVKVWPNKGIYDDAVVHTSLVWGRKVTRSLFSNRGVTGIANVEITPDYIARLASSYGAVLPSGSQIIIGADSHPFSSMIKNAFVQGLHSSGIHTTDVLETIAPVIRYTTATEEASGGVYLHFDERKNGKNEVTIEFYDHTGLPLDANFERKIENAFWQEDYRRAAFDMIGKGKVNQESETNYISGLLNEIKEDAVKRVNFRVVAHYNEKPYLNIVSKLLRDLNCDVLTVPPSMTAEEMSAFVKAANADLGVFINDTGESLRVMTKEGHILNDDLMLPLFVFVSFYSQKRKSFAVPVHGSSELDTIANRLSGQLIRTKANARSILKEENSIFSLLYDGLYALTQTLELLSLQNIALHEVMAMVPDIHMLRENVACPWDAKGRVMRMLMEEIRNDEVELLDGIKVYHDDGGWTLILPDVDEPLFTVYSQGPNPSRAQEASSYFVDKIKQYQKV